MTFSTAGRPLVFAHRGGCALGPENTLAAFDLGLEAGADGIELDVHLSSDDVVVVCHDDSLDRTTDATGPIRRHTASELAGVDAGFHFANSAGAFPFRGRGVGVPALHEVLKRYPGIRVIIEMKEDTEEMGRAVAEVVRSAGAAERVCAAGYGLRALRAAREALPEMTTSASHPEVKLAVYRSLAGWPVRDAPYEAFQVPERAGFIRILSPRFIRHVHDGGRVVQAWTIDDERDMERLLEWGVDGLISNRPDAAVQVRDRFTAARP